jgi:uncharacterized protein YegL
MAQTAIENVSFETTNYEPRCPVALVLDTSGSMGGGPIDELNAGLRELEQALKSDPVARLRVELALIPFGGSPRLVDPTGGRGDIGWSAEHGFVTADEFVAPRLSAGGGTPMGEAVMRALDLIESRKAIYKAGALNYYRPWILLITDGAPTDAWQDAAQQARERESARKFLFFAVGVSGADLQTLSHFSARQPLPLNGLAFRELFQWLSTSLSSVSRSKPGEHAQLSAPTWTSVST